MRTIIAPNVLKREFEADGPSQKWVADFTYIWTAEGWLCVAVVIDLLSRRVVGWSIQDTMPAQMVTDALIPLMVCKQTTAGQRMAIWRRGRPKELLQHSDQGRQYTSEPFQKLMAYQAEFNQLAGSIRADRLGDERELAKITRQIEQMVNAISEGTFHASMIGKITALETAQIAIRHRSLT